MSKIAGKFYLILTISAVQMFLTHAIDCTCDILPISCDVNCCCDNDCSQAEVSGFSGCQDLYMKKESRMCLSKTWLMFENILNLPASMNISTVETSTDFCFVEDNYAANNFYTEPKIPSGFQEFSFFYRAFASYTPNFTPLDGINRTPYYVSGARVYTVYPNNAVAIFSLPSKSPLSDFCNINNPAAYLYDNKTSCTRKILDLSADCEGDPGFSASSFYAFKLVSDPQGLHVAFSNLYLIARYTQQIVPDGTATCIDVDGVVTNCSLSFTATYDRTRRVCSNAVVGVEYTVTTRGVQPLGTTTVRFTLADIREGSGDQEQRFSINFVTNDTGISINTGQPKPPSFQKSGNPGYLPTSNVLAGDYIPHPSSPRISLNSDRDKWLTLPRASPDGSCQASNQQPVLFDVDMTTSCTVSISLENVTSTADCRDVQTSIYSTLTSQFSEYLHIAMYGNSDPNQPGDWLPIIRSNPGVFPEFSESGCINMVMGLRLEIIYADTGYIGNPQAKIIAARLNNDQYRTLSFKCGSSPCGGSQATSVSIGVLFIDASTAKVAVLPPKYQHRRPLNFFHPFVSSIASCTVMNIYLLIFISLVSL